MGSPTAENWLVPQGHWQLCSFVSIFLAFGDALSYVDTVYGYYDDAYLSSGFADIARLKNMLKPSGMRF